MKKNIVNFYFVLVMDVFNYDLTSYTWSIKLPLMCETHYVTKR